MKMTDLLILAMAGAVLFVVVRKVAAKPAPRASGYPASYNGNTYDPTGIYTVLAAGYETNANGDYNG